MADESFGVQEWLFKTLSQDTTIQSLVADRIYDGFAPLKSPTPSIIIQNQVPPRDIAAIGAIRINIEGEWLIKAVTTANSHSLKPILDRIDQLLHAKQELESYISIESCERVRLFKLEESRDSIIYRHRGQFYKIRAKST